MALYRFLIAVVLASVVFGDGAAGAAERDPTADCLKNAATSSIEPYPCDLALEIARSGADQRAIAAAYTNRGLILERAGRLNLALQDQDAAVSLLPDNPILLMNRAALLLRLGRTADALKDYDRAATLSPDDPAVFFSRTFAHLALGDLLAAQMDSERAGRLLASQLNP
jgi:tetratricopeptide (TPR) repeat protein